MKLEDILKQQQNNQPYGYNFESGNYIIKIKETTLDKLKTKKGTMYKLNMSCEVIAPNSTMNSKPFNIKYLGLDCGLFYNIPATNISSRKKEKKLLDFLINLSTYNNKTNEIYNISADTLADIIYKIIMINGGFIDLTFAGVILKQTEKVGDKSFVRFTIPYMRSTYKCISKDIMSLPEYNPILFEEKEENKEQPATKTPDDGTKRNDLSWLE